MTRSSEPQPDHNTIAVTSAAKAAIGRLQEENGDIVFHLTGTCCDARKPICLAKDDLSLGPRDRLIGHADGVPVYEMGEDTKGLSFRLDVDDGMSTGFSLSPGEGKCFALRETRG